MSRLIAAPLAAEDVPDWVKSLKIKGYMFGDYYGVAAHHEGAIEGATGFWFRRIYLTFDKKVSEELDVRLRFESASPGDFESSSKIESTVYFGSFSVIQLEYSPVAVPGR